MSFGGAKHMSEELTSFIANWEVESYRAKVALSGATEKRLAGKISIVTGSAQGFGAGIAEAMIREGAYVAIADMNFEGAENMAKSLCEKYGKGTAFPVYVNVTDEESVKEMIKKTVLEYGGLDVFVNNAGIVRAGSLEEMTKQNFELVTSIDYTAFFVCTKYAVVPMKIQRKYSPDYMSDVIGINSKSGLEGSNKNFAYAGAKFGGIGLTQSFALELAPYGIKCNSICPGNYLDGPLWSDPVRSVPQCRKSSRRKNGRGRPPLLRKQGPARQRLSARRYCKGAVLYSRTEIRNRSGCSRHRRTDHAQLTGGAGSEYR